MTKIFALALLGIMLMMPVVRAQDSSEPTEAKTPSESCRAACERDYAICGDETSAGHDTLMGRPGGSQVDHVRCGQELEACLNGCRGL
ncbi:MAG: hypothetical protein AB7G06_07845 [Bdellovibrionales bacterium]